MHCWLPSLKGKFKRNRLARRFADSVWLVAQDRLNHVHSTNPSTLFLMTAVSKICAGITPPASRHLRCSTQPQQHVMDSSIVAFLLYPYWSNHNAEVYKNQPDSPMPCSGCSGASDSLSLAAAVIRLLANLLPGIRKCGPHICRVSACVKIARYSHPSSMSHVCKLVPKMLSFILNWKMQLLPKEMAPGDQSCDGAQGLQTILFSKSYLLELGRWNSARPMAQDITVVEAPDLGSITTRSELQIQDRYLMGIPQRFLARDAWTLHDESKMNPRWVAHRHLLPSDAVGAARWRESKPKLNTYVPSPFIIANFGTRTILTFHP